MAETFEADYRALTEGAGLVDLSGRTRIEVGGDDRAGFLHNLSTNDVKRLRPGDGCEAFLLNARGHVLGHVFLICRGESIIIETVAGQSEALLSHLNRYLIREKVEMRCRGDDWGELLLAGAGSQAALAAAAQGELPSLPLANAEVLIAGQTATVVRVSFTPQGGFLIFFPREARGIVSSALQSAGAAPCEAEALEAARIEAGFPYYGADITEKNLPQEVGRDALAISFNKGCYIGQETVARIDALGHVNKTLVILRFSQTETPPPGTELRRGDQTVGHVTSSAFSPRLGAPLALAYLRRVGDQGARELTSAFGPANVMRDER